MRKKIDYEGRVQGVGFRYAVLMASRCYGVTGFVRNEYNGSVQLIVEGEEGEIDSFLAEIYRRMSMNIGSVSVTAAEATGEFSGFDIRH